MGQSLLHIKRSVKRLFSARKLVQPVQLLGKSIIFPGVAGTVEDLKPHRLRNREPVGSGSAFPCIHDPRVTGSMPGARVDEKNA